MGVYRKKGSVVNATRWVELLDHGAVRAHLRSDGEFNRRTGFGVLDLPDGSEQIVKPGDWIVTFENGSHYSMPEREFFEVYEELS